MDSSVSDAKLQKFGTRSHTVWEQYITKRAQDGHKENEVLVFQRSNYVL